MLYGAALWRLQMVVVNCLLPVHNAVGYVEKLLCMTKVAYTH